MPIDVFKREVDHQLRELRESKRLPGVDAIYFPGELRAQRRSDRQRNGVPLADEVLIQLDNLADELGVAKLARR